MIILFQSNLANLTDYLKRNIILLSKQASLLATIYYDRRLQSKWRILRGQQKNKPIQSREEKQGNFSIIIICQNTQKLCASQMERVQRISINTIRQQYQVLRSLGQGNNGCVYLYRQRESQQQFALKITKTSNLHKRDEAMGQIQIMTSLKHPHIVKIFKFYEESFPGYLNKRYEVGALMEKGISSLDNLLRDHSYRYSIADIRRFIVKFIQLGAYLESKKIVHRDIKPGNIIIFGEGLIFKLGDFGLSCEAFNRPRGFAGTPAYCSPGLKIFLNYGNHRLQPITLAFKDDVYSLGLTFQQVVMARYQRQNCPKDIIDLIEEMIIHEERDRPTFIGLLSHKSYLKYKGIQQSKELPKAPPKIQEKAVQFSPESIRRGDFTKKKSGEKDLTLLNHFTQKSKRVKEQVYMDTNYKQIRTICQLGESYIICGTERGEIISIDKTSGQIVKLSIGHKGYAAKIMMDKKHQFWSSGADGCVFMIKGEQLIRNIQNNKKQEVIKMLTINGQQSSYKLNTAKIDEEIISRILQNPREKFISQLYAQDQNHFAIGYCNGSVAVKWGEDPFKIYTINTEPITCIAIQNGILYSGDYSGFVKCYSLEKKIIEKMVYRLEKELISIKVTSVEYGLNIEGVSCNGRIKIINLYKYSQTTFNAQIPTRYAISTAYSSNSFFLLTRDGQIFFKSNQLTKFQKEGNDQNWTCLIEVNQNELIAASREGIIWVVTLQN